MSPKSPSARSPPFPAYRERLAQAKAASTGQLLLKSARLLNELAVARVRRLTGERRLRPSHTGVFPHLDLEGTRLTTLAQRLGITKQAVSELVADLEDMRVVECVADPSDGRAKLVRFSRRGREALLHGVSVLGGIENELAVDAGSQPLQRLRESLALILPALETLHGKEMARRRDE